MMANGAVSWQSIKQKSVAISTTEAEYVSLSEGVKEAIFLTRFMRELVVKRESPITIHTDSQSAMAIATNPVQHQHTKHIDVRYHFAREAIMNGIVILKYLQTEHMIADVLTKALPREKQMFCRMKMGVME